MSTKRSHPKVRPLVWKTDKPKLSPVARLRAALVDACYNLDGPDTYFAQQYMGDRTEYRILRNGRVNITTQCWNPKDGWSDDAMTATEAYEHLTQGARMKTPTPPSRPKLRALFVRQSRTSGPYGYELRMQTDHTNLGVFLVPKSYDYYEDQRGKDRNEWLTSMHKRFAFIPANKQAGIVTIQR